MMTPTKILSGVVFLLIQLTTSKLKMLSKTIGNSTTEKQQMPSQTRLIEPQNSCQLRTGLRGKRLLIYYVIIGKGEWASKNIQFTTQRNKKVTRSKRAKGSGLRAAHK